MALDILGEYEKAGAIYLDKHFVYTTGKHGSAYINTDPLFPRTLLVSELSDLLVEPFLGNGVQTVVAPATGGIVLAVQAALAFGRHGQDVATAWADKGDNRTFLFDRVGFVEQVTGKRVLVVEDLLNTGGSVEKVCRLVEQEGGQLVGASVLCNRGPSTAHSLQVPRLEAVTTVTMDVYEADGCPLCEADVPIVNDISHGDKFQADHPDYAGGFVSINQ